MSKKLFPYLFGIVALFVGALYYNHTIQSPLLSFLNSLKVSYHQTLHSLETTIEEHFFQAQEIQRLSKKLQNYEKNLLLMQQLNRELSSLYKENNSSLHYHADIELVRAISYQKFGKLNRIWLDVPDYNASKIYGLIYGDLVAGIVIPKEKKALALLNSDIKSTYAVYVGNEHAPGIAHGNNDKNLVVNFIPAWFSIKPGDEVTSSGLDNIFFKGLKVGRVVSVSKSQGYQNAVVEPYFRSNELDYFHIIRSLR